MRHLALAFAFVASGGSAFAADDAGVAQSLAPLLQQAANDDALARTGNKDEVQRFYALLNGNAAWRRDGHWTAQAELAVAALESADREGLNPGDYLAAMPSLLPDSDAMPAIARADVLLSAGMLRYIADIHSGRVVPTDVSSEYSVHPARPDAATLLKDGLGAVDFGSWLSALPPDDPAYRRLREALANYRAMAESWPLLPDAPTLKLGASESDVTLLRRQLVLLGDLKQQGDAASADFDIDVDAAVRRFQSRNGLKSDGAVGAQTRAALNVTPHARADQIALNLERLRWFPHPASGRYVIINAAGFALTAVADGKIAAKMPVIVGTSRRRTPVFSDQITAVTFNPTWTVPPKIAREEILPKIRRDPDYLAKQNMKVYSGWDSDSCEVNPSDVDWKSIRPGALKHRFVQQPGAGNALGRIRFTIHNEFGIFLHDTPAKKLFGQEARAYSHGCIRVGDAVALAGFVFDGDPDWPRSAIEAAANGSATKVVELRTPIPLEVVYLTAWVEEDGTVQFRPDVYRRDEPLLRALVRPNLP